MADEVDAGSPNPAWTGRFRSLDERLLDRIKALLPVCLSDLGTDAGEDQITLNLVARLLRDTETRQMIHFIEFQFHPTELVGGVEVSLGIIDMAAFRDQDRQYYLAYECKRLNVKWKGRRYSLAGPYVLDGLKRFSTEQYCKGIPVGWMIGYVMDADIPFAAQKVTAAIKQHADEVTLVDGPSAALQTSIISRFSTAHATGSGSKIRVEHALMC